MKKEYIVLQVKPLMFGKAKEDFLKWLFEQKELKKFLNSYGMCGVDNFNSLPFSMRCGVYMDFYDSLRFNNDNDKEKSIRWDESFRKSIRGATKFYNENL